MSEGQSVADLMLRMGVDVGEMISGFNSAGRISRQMAKDMAEGMNASLQKAFDPSVINSGRMFENLETQYRATVSTMLRESIQARAVIERSAENVKRFALEAAEADKKVMGDLLTEQANFYNVKQNLRTAELTNIQATANQELEIQQRSLAMQAALRERYAAEIAEFEAETAADNQQRMINEANQRDTLQLHATRSASLENMKSLTDAETEILARSTALREDILERYRLQRQREIAEEARAQEMLTEQMERGNEALRLRNRLRREARAFAFQLEEAGITPGSARYNQMTQAFRQEQQRQRDEFANRDRRAAATRRQNELDQQAARIIRSVMSAEAAHAQRLRELEELYQTNRLSLDQYNEAMRQSEQVMNSQRAGSGGATGVLAQLSFGIEDFAQGLAMGDLRAAMLGASNNITMVVRGLRDMTSETRTATFAAMRLPLALAGLAGAGAAALGLYHHLVNMNTEMKSLADRIAEATRQYFKFNQADELASRQEQRAEELKAVDTLEGIEVKRRQAELAHADLMRKLETERNENNVRGREAIMKMLGGEANFIELQQYLQEKGTQESQIALDQLSRAQAAALKGNTEVAFNEMKMLFEFLDRESTKGSFALFRALAEGSPGTVKELTLFDLPALNELQKYFKQGGLSTLSMWGDSEEALAEIRTVLDGIAKDESKAAAERKDAAKAMEEIDKRTAELAAQRKMDEEHLAKLEADKLEMRQQAAKFDAETVRLRQQEELFLIKATDQEKELYRLRKEQQGFVRPQAAVVGLDPILNALMAQGMADTQQADQIAFLEAQKQAAQNEMNALMQQAIPKAQGALEQNAFQAQADAFKQMTENMAQKPNPQLTQVVNRLKAIEDAIKAGGAFIQVGP